MATKIFVDSDVVISSLLSSKGAARSLINTRELSLFISNKSLDELRIVAKRLKISENSLEVLVKARFRKVKIGKSKDIYNEHVLDVNDAHVLHGAVRSKSGFLVSYNTKHYKVEKIKRDFNIIVTTPAYLLQYLRSID